MGQWYLYTFNRDGIPLRPQSVQRGVNVKARKFTDSTPGIPFPGVFAFSGQGVSGCISAFQAVGFSSILNARSRYVWEAHRSLTFMIDLAKTNGAGQPVVVLGLAHNQEISEAVRLPSPATIEAGIVQLVEQRNHNPYVSGSTPLSGTIDRHWGLAS